MYKMCGRDAQFWHQRKGKFNRVEIRQHLDLHRIRMDDLRTVLSTLRHKLTDVNFSTNLATPNSVLNIMLRGPSQSSDVYNIKNPMTTMLKQFWMNWTSNAKQWLNASDRLEFVVTAALNKRGDMRHKLENILYFPFNTIIYAFSMCLVCYMYPHAWELNSRTGATNPCECRV